MSEKQARPLFNNGRTTSGVSEEADFSNNPNNLNVNLYTTNKDTDTGVQDQPLTKKLISKEEEEEATESSKAKLKGKTYLYAILTLNLFMCFGMNYVFDFPQALADPLIRSLRIDTFQIGLLYSVYSLPNIFLTPVVGVIIGKLGIHSSAVLYTFLLFVGQLGINVGIQYRNFVLVLIGRAVVGAGGEGISIVQLTINELWFFGHFLSASVAWCEIFGIFAEFLGNTLHPELFVATRGLSTPFFAMGLFSAFSCVIGVIYYFQHQIHEGDIQAHDDDSDDDNVSETVISGSTSSVINRTEEDVGEITSKSNLFPNKNSKQAPLLGRFKTTKDRSNMRVSFDLKDDEDYEDDVVMDETQNQVPLGVIAEEGEDSDKKDGKKEKSKPKDGLEGLQIPTDLSFGLKSIKYFNGVFWILCAVNVFLSNCYHQFCNIMTEILVCRFQFSYEDSNQFTIIPQVVFICIAPFLSRWVEQKGAKPLFLMVASVVFLVSFTWLYSLEAAPSVQVYYSYALIGIGYAIITCALFSSVALTVPKAGVGMAFSILTLVENIGMAVFPLYFGQLAEERTVQAYDDCLLSLVCIAFIALILSAILLISDIKTTGLLRLPENSKGVKKIRRKIDSEYLERSMRDSMIRSQSGRLGRTENRRKIEEVKHTLRKAASFAN